MRCSTWSRGGAGWLPGYCVGVEPPAAEDGGGQYANGPCAEDYGPARFPLHTLLDFEGMIYGFFHDAQGFGEHGDVV